MVTDVTPLLLHVTEILERQLRDVAGVLELQRGSIDMPYLERVARELGLTDLLDRCVEDAERPS